jgi:hypothetical protein
LSPTASRHAQLVTPRRSTLDASPDGHAGQVSDLRDEDRISKLYEWPQTLEAIVGDEPVAGQFDVTR